MATGFVIAFVKGWFLTLVMLSSIPLLVIAGGIMSVTIAKMTPHGKDAYAKASIVVVQIVGSIRMKKANKDLESLVKREDTDNPASLGAIAFIDSKMTMLSPATTIDEKSSILNTNATDQIVSAGSESRPPMLNKENYMPWSSRLLRYTKSRPNGKLIHNSILNGPYVRKMIPEPGDANRDINITETSHLQTDDELSDKELKQIEADDQAIQTILLGLPEDIYVAVDSCETDQEICLKV
uniref:ABC transporter B family member 11-like n=1 Tax=Tanacetum cinerariifolium TaxID=118510 RepID=A0A699IPZ2_TANCI|nr:ABC transporter B family member 11-like [Tanacetum cinerariifolium]